MKVKANNSEIEYVVLGENAEKYLIYPDVTGMTSWYDKSNCQPLKSAPNYLVEDNHLPGQKVVEIFKREHDLDFYTGKLEWNESLTPLCFKYKRIELALSNIGMKDFFAAKYNSFSDEFYFAMLVGKFETINEIIDANLQEREAHSRFEWHKNSEPINVENQFSKEEVEKGIIELCEFVSSKTIQGKYSKLLFTDIYGLWKTFLLGDEFEIYGEMKMEEDLEPKFICTFRKGGINYKFDYQFYNW